MTRSNRHKKPVGKIIGIVLAVVLIGLGAAYTVRSNHYSTHFLPKTVINDTNIGNLTVEQANTKLKGDADNRTFVVKDQDSSWKSIKKTDFGLKSDYHSELKKILANQNDFSWGPAYVFASEQDDLDGTVIDNDKLNQELANFKKELEDFNSKRTKTSDAHVSKGPAGYTVTPEVVGDSVNVDEVMADMKKAITNDDHELELTNYVEAPKVLATDEKLKTQVQALNKIATIKANYSINGNDFQIPTEEIMNWLEYKDGKASINKEKVRAYVAELGKQYNTSSNPTTFNSTKRGEVSVPDGTLSWTIQTDAETEALVSQLEAGDDFTRSPITKGSADANSPLIGNTYIEVDLENQHMWYYKDGAVALETDIVSGKPKSPTPTGVFYVWNKSQNETLKGTNDDGSKYASPVDYWMPIDWTGVGIHDSDWQPAYGGQLWKTVGSHGCINTPPNVMKQLYGTVEKGTPVIVF